jgi:dihydroneopterin triphosphate diphosphatase
MPTLRTDLVDVYVFRRSPSVEFLQLQRAGEPLAGTWQPVMGHIESGESATQCAFRELHEETGLAPASEHLLGFWALQEVHPYYLAAADAVMLSPRFAAEVSDGWSPTLNHEHTGYRWVAAADVGTSFLWRQKAACREVLTVLVAAAPAAEHLRIDHRH